MDDLISRQAAIDALKRDEEYDEDIPNRADGVRDAIITISNLPTATERKKGEWEEIEVIADAYDISGVKTWASKMMCDQCGFTTIAIEGHFSQYNFCPNCGADMGGEKR